MWQSFGLSWFESWEISECRNSGYKLRQHTQGPQPSLPHGFKASPGTQRAQSSAFHLPLGTASNLSGQTKQTPNKAFYSCTHSHCICTGSCKESSQQDIAHLLVVHNIHQPGLRIQPNITIQGWIHSWECNKQPGRNPVLQIMTQLLFGIILPGYRSVLSAGRN